MVELKFVKVDNIIIYSNSFISIIKILFFIFILQNMVPIEVIIYSDTDH